MPLLNTTKNGVPLKPKKKKIAKKELEIRDKLTGKNYSPIVAKSRKELIKKKKSNSSKVAAKRNDEKSALPKVQAPSEKTEKKIIDNPLKRAFESTKENLSEAKKKKKVSFEIDSIPKKSKMEKISIVDSTPKKSKVEKISIVKPNLKTEKSNEVNSHKGDVVIIKKVKKKTMKIDSDTKPGLVTKKLNKPIIKSIGAKEVKSDLPLTKKKSKSKESLPAKEPEEVLSTTKGPIFVESSAKNIEEVNTETAESQEIGVKEEVKSAELTNTKAEKKKTKKKLKSISNIKAVMKRPLKANSLKKKGRTQQQGVCIFKNIPHGFYGKELENYCSQFGKVTGVYHPVSKNGNSRGYAFVRFAHSEVAKVVAETMNNYVMFYKRIRCELVPKEREKPGMFNVAKTNEELSREKREAGLKQRMRQLSKPEVAAWEKRKKARLSALHKKLSDLGVDYEFKVNDSIKTSNPKSPKSIKVK